MKGFFSIKQTESASRPNGKILSCASCGCYKKCSTPKMQPIGNFKKQILILGSSPERIDDKRGLAFQNSNADFLNSTLASLGIDMFEDCLLTYAHHCYKPDAECTPSNYEIECCRKTTIQTTKNNSPKVIILLGNSAVFSLIGHRWKRDLHDIDRWRGWCIPDQDFKAWVCPTFDTFQVREKTEILTVWKSDLQEAISHKDIPFPKYKEPEIIYLEDDLSILNTIKGDVAFDYETTGLKPHAEGHKIICCSIAVSEDKVYVFMMPKSRKARKPFTDLLTNPKIGKIAQNMKYELAWSQGIFGVAVQNWVWDTMLATHVLDNRTGITGLKLQTFVQFGLVDYESEVSSYLKSDEKNANSINRIQELVEKPGGAKLLMKYCALDSAFEYRLYQKQKSEIENSTDNLKAFDLLMDGTLALARAERQGIRIDMEYVNRKKQQMTNKIEHLEEEFRETLFFKNWQKRSKAKININSGTQLGDYLYKVLKIAVGKETKSGMGSTDEEALKQLNIPELDYLLKIGKLKKIRDTYLDGYTREQVDGYLHPFFNLNTVVSFRSSSNSPNFQNIPKRDEFAMQTVRSAMFPRPGHLLLEIDYSGVEVRINAAINQDKNLVRYIKDPSTDMHRDIAIQLFRLDKYDEKIEGHKLLRQAAKNGFVFPQFYGDWYKSCAENVACNWGELPKTKWKAGQGISLNGGTISDHLISKGLDSFFKFTEHVKAIETDLWQSRFPEYAKWKDTWFAKYQKTGYIDLLTGFRCSGVMNKKQACNYPGQNGGFMCLLWSFIEADRIMIEEKWDTKLLGQIHDSILLDVLPSELDHVVEVLYRITCKDLPKAWKWLNIPLDIDMEICAVDQPWSKKKKYVFR